MYSKSQLRVSCTTFFFLVCSEDAEGNENVADQANADQQRERNQALGSRQPERRGGLSLGFDLGLDDDDLESEIGAHLPANRSQNIGQTDSLLQVGVDNIGNRMDDTHQSRVESVDDEDANGNGNGNGDQDDDQASAATSRCIGDKAEIEDKEQSEQRGQVVEIESIGDDQGGELIDNNNLNRIAINELKAQLTTLYNRPTANRDENFDDVITQLFNRYSELTNERTSNQQRQYFEGLTLKADNAMIDIEQQQEQIKQIETELKELYEIPEENRESTFDMIANNLWTRYTELTNVERTASLREECDNILLTANEIERIMVEEETKERIKQIQIELTDLYS